ncbi:MAG: SLC13 family permease [Candidatus Marsarchaeota archaeon]|nr:SLC13 family permease [Candidatus Marsarchaeota archaeon]
MVSFIPILIVVAVFVLVAIRSAIYKKLRIWWITMAGAIVMLLLGQISINLAITYVNFDIILFLLGIFIIGVALEESGYIAYISYKLFKRARSTNTLILFIIFGMGLISTILMNDAVAIIGTPLMLMASKENKINSKMLLFALAFSITIGSVMSPIGNPQNLIVASNKIIVNPFSIFFIYLAIPTIINLFVLYLFIRVLFKSEINKKIKIKKPKVQNTKGLFLLSKISISLFLVLIIVYIFYTTINIGAKNYLFYIPIVSALPIIIFSKKRLKIIKNVDWGTILFFISMFVIIGGIWQSGILQSITLIKSASTSLLNIMVFSMLGSQFISNVPLVLLYTNILNTTNSNIMQLMALASGSTIAGNMLVLGAASNVIIISIAEKRNHNITFAEFAKIGLPLALINMFIYLAFFYL